MKIGDYVRCTCGCGCKGTIASIDGNVATFRESQGVFTLFYLELVTMATKATWANGVLTVGDQNLSLCPEGLKTLGIKHEAGNTYELEIKVVKTTEKPKIKVGQVIRHKRYPEYRGTCCSISDNRIYFYNELLGGRGDWLSLDDVEVVPL